jgi:hypothetical protein
MDETKEKLMRQYQEALAEETPYDVANGSREWDQADHTPGIDQLANEIGIMEAEMAAQEGTEEEPEPIFDNPYDEPEEVEIIEPVKPNRHERRKRAKLARLLAMKEKLEAEARKRGN